MKKIVVILLLVVATGSLLAQPKTSKLDNGRHGTVVITPALSKEVLTYTYITITDDGLLGESSWHCPGKCFFEDDHPEERLFKVDEEELSVVPKYDYSSDFTNGYAIVVEAGSMDGYDGRYWALDGGENYALANKQGKIVIPFKKYDKITQGVYEGLVTVMKNGQWGFASPDGVVRIKMEYDDARHFSEGLAAVKKDGKWGYIDKTGNVKIPFNFNYAGNFHRGVAMVCVNSLDTENYTISDYIDDELHTATGLVDQIGRTTFDCLKNEVGIKEYNGAYYDDITEDKGEARYSYYEDAGGKRIKHGYYIFNSSDYYVDGYYKDGKKFGKWRFSKKSNSTEDIIDENVMEKTVDVEYENDMPNGDFNVFEGYDEFYISGRCRNGVPYGEVTLWPTIVLDNDGVVTGDVEFSNYAYSSDIPMSVTITFFKGAPVQAVEQDISTGAKKVLFKFDGFTSVDAIGQTVSNNVRLYVINDTYYELVPKDPDTPFTLFDVNKYPEEMARDMNRILSLPASWTVPFVRSPKLNYLKHASHASIRDFEYPKYSAIFDSYEEYAAAYDKGETSFKERIDEKLKEKKEAAYKKNKHLFATRDEFESVYKNGDAAFNTDVEFRILAFEDYQKEKEWFVDFHEYSLYQQAKVREVYNNRKVEY